MNVIAVQLLDGLPAARRAQTAWIRPLTGIDEAGLHDCAGATAAARATEVIAAAMVRLGELTSLTRDDARALTIGDRERVMLAIAVATLGEVVDVVARCQAGDCGELVEFPLQLDDLLKQAGAHAAPPRRELALQTAEQSYALQVRPPTGADHEAAAELALTDTEAAAALLLERCAAPIPEGGLPAEIAAAVEAAVCAIDPAAEFLTEMSCPACGRSVQAVLDSFSLLASGLASADRLFAEVDAIARTYHWSETEILALTISRRRRYLDLIAAEGAA